MQYARRKEWPFLGATADHCEFLTYKEAEQRRAMPSVPEGPKSCCRRMARTEYNRLRSAAACLSWILIPLIGAIRESINSASRGIITVRDRLLWLLLLGIVIALLLLLGRHGGGTVGPPTTDEFGSLAYKLAILFFLVGALFAIFRDRLTEAITGAMLWAVIGIALVIGYSYRYEVHQVADRVMAELVPGHVISHGRTAEVARTGSGDFAISAQINGGRVHMVVDTGATSVVLTAEDAKTAGLPLALLKYTVSVETANGRYRAAPSDARSRRNGRARRALRRGARGASPVSCARACLA